MINVAIIEDHDATRTILEEIINREPEHRCVCSCSTSREAIEKVPKHPVDVALVDIFLPDQSGVLCATLLTELVPNLQVILLTVYQDTDLIFPSLTAGASGYILKRSRPNEILQAITEAMDAAAPVTSPVAGTVVRSIRTPAKRPTCDGLTSREAQILELLAEGLSNKEIGHRIHISAGTVRNHLDHIFKKLHVRCRTEAAVKYLRAK